MTVERISSDHQQWKKHWLKYFASERRHLVLMNNELKDSLLVDSHPATNKFTIGIGPITCRHRNSCPSPSDIHFFQVWTGDSNDEAAIVFEHVRERIIKREK